MIIKPDKPAHLSPEVVALAERIYVEDSLRGKESARHALGAAHEFFVAAWELGQALGPIKVDSSYLGEGEQRDGD